MGIAYAVEPDLSAQEFRDVLVASTLGERRPVDDLDRLDRMLRAANLIITARDGGKLVGMSRAMTDFAYFCYLSDLAVDKASQRQGIGKRLISETHKRAGDNTQLVLVAAPGAETYYHKIGMRQALSCWIIPRTG